MSRTPSIFGQPSWLVFAPAPATRASSSGDGGRDDQDDSAHRAASLTRASSRPCQPRAGSAAGRGADPNRATLRGLARHITVRVGWGARALLASGLCLAALVAAESVASAAVASRPLRAAAFTTRIPAGWPVVAFTDDASVYRIRSPATSFDASGIQRPGGVGVFLSVYTRAQFARSTARLRRHGRATCSTRSRRPTTPPRPSRSSRRTARRSAESPRSRRPSRSASRTPRTSRPTSSRVTATTWRS